MPKEISGTQKDARVCDADTGDAIEVCGIYTKTLRSKDTLDQIIDEKSNKNTARSTLKQKAAPVSQGSQSTEEKFNKILKYLKKRQPCQNWREGLAVKSTYCSARGPRFDFQYPHNSLSRYRTPVWGI